MGFKEDAQFARYLTIGVQGTQAVVEDLKGRGHELVELERYAVGNKVWEVRPKRLRLPDLLCLRCGRRIESKGKSKLEIKLSHGKPGGGREWWQGGMRPDDVFAFVHVAGGGEQGGPVSTGRPVYVTRQALEDALGSVKAGTRKAIADGAEADIAWPAWVPSYDGVVVGLEERGCVVVEQPDGSRRTYRNGAAWAAVHLHRKIGEAFEGNRDVVASAVAPASVGCEGDVWQWWDHLLSEDADDRYAAVKACRYHGPDRVESDLVDIAKRGDEDWRVRLEAVAALASLAPEPWTSVLVEAAVAVTAPLDRQMEAVFILSEIGTEAARDGLLHVAALTDRHEEVRAAAVWGLGLGRERWPVYAGLFLDDPSDRVALHAAAAMPRVLPSKIEGLIRGWLRAGSPRQSAVAAAVLARHADLEPLLLAAVDPSATGRLYAINALGRLPRAHVESQIGGGMPQGLREVLEAMWVQQDDWLQTSENSGALDVLEAQRLRLLGRL